MRFTDRDEVDDLVRKGKDLERVVLARAVQCLRRATPTHLQNRLLVYVYGNRGNRTVVFE